MLGRQSVHFLPCSNAPSDRGVSIFPYSFQHRGLGIWIQIGHTWCPPQHPEKTTRAFSDGRQDPQLGIGRHKDICFSIYLFFIWHGHSPVVLKLMAYNPLRASTSPSSFTSSCHRKTKPKIPPEFLVHFTGSAHKQLHRFKLRECLCGGGSPTLWQALLSIYYFIQFS